MAERTYRIGEAASLLNLKTYVLRFWETEFPQLDPLRTEKGQRLYTEADLALLRRIRFLLHERGLTIEGARRMLAERGVAAGPGLADAAPGLAELRDFGPDAPDMPELPDADDVGGDQQADAGFDDETRHAAPASVRPAARMQAWDQYLHGLLLPDEGAAVNSGQAHGGDAAPRTVRSADAAPPGTVREIIAELEALRRLLTGAA
ncbi:merR regulatory family protein [Desulfovibrio sp. A2]|nr:merR regulatory family protein [Desulfovibrio sp. A2]